MVFYWPAPYLFARFGSIILFADTCIFFVITEDPSDGDLIVP